MFTKSTVTAKYSLLGVSCIIIIRIHLKVSEQMSKSGFFLSRSRLLGLQPCDKAAMLWVNTIAFFLEQFTKKIEFSSQKREMLLFLTTNNQPNPKLGES